MDVDDMDFLPAGMGELNNQASTMMDLSRYFGKMNVDDSLIKSWICIYPNYLDSQKSIKKGRKLLKEQCLDLPDIRIMYEAALVAGLSAIIEMEKMHPQAWETPGRLRIELKSSNGAWVHPTARSRLDCLQLIQENYSSSKVILTNMPEHPLLDRPPGLPALDITISGKTLPNLKQKTTKEKKKRR